MPPTKDAWKLMVATYGYHAALTMIDCDLDEVPGIEETWLENFADMAEEFARTELEFLRRIGAISTKH